MLTKVDSGQGVAVATVVAVVVALHSVLVSSVSSLRDIQILTAEFPSPLPFPALSPLPLPSAEALFPVALLPSAEAES